MYNLDLEITITEIKITKDYNIALLKGHVSTLILLDFSEHLKLLINYLTELLLLRISFPPLAALSLLFLKSLPLEALPLCDSRSICPRFPNLCSMSLQDMHL